MSAVDKLLARALALPLQERAKLLAGIAQSFVPADGDGGSTLAHDDHRSAWDAWAAAGEQGPISDDEGPPELP